MTLDTACANARLVHSAIERMHATATLDPAAAAATLEFAYDTLQEYVDAIHEITLRQPTSSVPLLVCDCCHCVTEELYEDDVCISCVR